MAPIWEFVRRPPRPSRWPARRRPPRSRRTARWSTSPSPRSARPPAGAWSRPARRRGSRARRAARGRGDARLGHEPDAVALAPGRVGEGRRAAMGETGPTRPTRCAERGALVHGGDDDGGADHHGRMRTVPTRKIRPWNRSLHLAAGHLGDRAARAGASGPHGRPAGAGAGPGAAAAPASRRAARRRSRKTTRTTATDEDDGDDRGAHASASRKTSDRRRRCEGELGHAPGRRRRRAGRSSCRRRGRARAGPRRPRTSDTVTPGSAARPRGVAVTLDAHDEPSGPLVARSSTRPAATSRPWSMIVTDSQRSSTWSSWWLEKMHAAPGAGAARPGPRRWRRCPSGRARRAARRG